tara:strand:+ start:2264 stop:3376 length:1113 start_codon:yes stop_codon:yes gene_type:complete
MASTIDYNPNKKRALLYFLKNAKQNESMTIDPDTGHRSYVFIFTKRGKSAVVQMVWKWHYSWAHNRPIAKMSQDSILFYGSPNRPKPRSSLKHICSGYGGDTLRGLFRLGLIPGLGKKYRKRIPVAEFEIKNRGYHYSSQWDKGKDGKPVWSKVSKVGIGIETLRGTCIANFNGQSIGVHYPLRFDWDGNLLSPIPKFVEKLTKQAIREDREIKNRNARNNYANTKIVRYLKEARETLDYSKLKIADIFTLTNTAYRTELINIFGMEKILETLDYILVDKEELNNCMYELLLVELPDTRPSALSPMQSCNYLKMSNPSTGEIHIEGIRNRYNNAPINRVRQALAWRDGQSSMSHIGEYLPKEYIEPIILT